MEKESDELTSSMIEFERQLASAKRELQRLPVKGLTYDEDTCVLRTDHAAILRRREEALLAQRKAQLTKNGMQRCGSRPLGRSKRQ